MLQLQQKQRLFRPLGLLLSSMYRPRSLLACLSLVVTVSVLASISHMTRTDVAATGQEDARIPFPQVKLRAGIEAGKHLTSNFLMSQNTDFNEHLQVEDYGYHIRDPGKFFQSSKELGAVPYMYKLRSAVRERNKREFPPVKGSLDLLATREEAKPDESDKNALQRDLGGRSNHTALKQISTKRMANDSSLFKPQTSLTTPPRKAGIFWRPNLGKTARHRGPGDSKLSAEDEQPLVVDGLYWSDLVESNIPKGEWFPSTQYH
ncbi:hypothetical protein ElyMa_006825600 [Elysia marginata]|uniref:Uncharacterized protein n=1 Tax=Elysia marginata TaxID=1093978 RepID=A0AAV4J7Y0_9GAST|nr:hypothetical protein ElyMa_006825600 [Elysia marginata]